MSTRSRAAEDADHYVYRCYDADGSLIYIGCTSNIKRRLAAHLRGEKRTSRWLALCMVQHEVEGPYRGREAGRAAEARAIREEQPLFNYQARAGVGLAAWMTRRPIAVYLVERGHIELAAETLCECDREIREAGELDPYCYAHVAAKVAGLTDLPERAA